METNGNTETREETPHAHKTLVQALIAAQRRVKAVAKKAKNTHHGYNYASADAIIDEASEALAMEGLAVFPVSIDRDPLQVEHVWQRAVLVKDGVEVDDSWIITPRRIRAVYMLVHESGEQREFQSSTPVIPEKGRPEDKAEFGARTENLGYALRDLLLIPREDQAAQTPSARDDRGYQQRGPAGEKPKAAPASTAPQQRPASNGNGAQPAPKAQTSAAPPAASRPAEAAPAAAPPPVAAASATTPEATGPTVERDDGEAMDNDQDLEVSQLFKKLKFSRTAAMDEVTKLLGRGAGFTKADGAKLIEHLKAKLAGAAS